jgi:predicted  nucleic acid-binding Zn-ribbon protein
MSDDIPLLELQRLDTLSDGLVARLEGLPERAARAACAAGLTETERELEATRLASAELEREERAIEVELAALQEKASGVEQSLYSGKTTVLKELEALQAELDGLGRKRVEHEEAGLAVLERADQLEQRVGALQTRRAELAAEDAALAAAIEGAESEISAELEGLSRERSRATEQIPPAMLPVYEKLRTLPRLEGRVTARLEGNGCGACRVTLPVMDATRARSEGREVAVQCPACTRILVIDG